MTHAAEGGPALRLHIGAHKTATTHLQDNLAAQERQILSHGWTYVPRPFIRRSGLLRAVFANALQAEKRRSLAEMLVLPPQLPRRFILSEEDILGSSADLLTGLYPHARPRLEAWAAIAPPGAAEVFLAIRDYAGLLPSAYSQALRDGSPVPPFAACLDPWITGTLSWVSLVETAIAVFGPGRLTVWTTEHYLANPAAVLSAFAGMALAEARPGAPSATSRLSAETVRALEQLPPAARREAAARLAAEATPGTRFDPLPAHQKALLAGLYREDVARIRKLPVTFLG